MRHVPDSPKKEYRRITFYIEDIQELFKIAQDHNQSRMTVTFSKLKPSSGGSWNIDEPSKLSDLALKFQSCTDFHACIAVTGGPMFEDVDIWADALGLRVWTSSDPANRLVFDDIDRWLMLKTAEKSRLRGWIRNGGVYFFPTNKPPPTSAGFFAKMRDEAAKTAVSEIVKAVIYALVGGTAVVAYFHHAAKIQTPLQPTTTAASQP